ncbi:DUF7742 family protein [Marivita sp.]|uniref:DUF7742 family protein n=1 Tax=Marivita sp. TaxID=2003365 RepID=UPI003F6CEAC6
MKPLIYNDVLAAVAVVSAVPHAQRPAKMARLLDEAIEAESYRLKHHAAHPIFGDGSLLASAQKYDVKGSTSFQTRDALGAWVCVLSALLNRLDQPEAQPMQRVAVGSSSSRLRAISSPQSSQ